MNLTSFIALLKNFGAKLEGNAQVKWLANEDGFNLTVTDSKDEWTARISVSRNTK